MSMDENFIISLRIDTIKIKYYDEKHKEDP